MAADAEFGEDEIAAVEEYKAVADTVVGIDHVEVCIVELEIAGTAVDIDDRFAHNPVDSG